MTLSSQAMVAGGLPKAGQDDCRAPQGGQWLSRCFGSAIGTGPQHAPPHCGESAPAGEFPIATMNGVDGGVFFFILPKDEMTTRVNQTPGNVYILVNRPCTC